MRGPRATGGERAFDTPLIDPRRGGPPRMQRLPALHRGARDRVMRGAVRATAAAAVTLTVALALGLPAAAARADTLARGVGSGTVSALRERAVWSQPVDDGARYRLVQSVHGGSPRRVPGVRPRRGPFDVDLGVDRSGEMVATYSRCRNQDLATPSIGIPVPRLDTARGCRLYEYAFGTARERRLRPPGRGRSQYLPSRWGPLLAFAERDHRVAREQPGAVRVMVVDLVTGRQWRRPGGTLGAFSDFIAGGPGPVALDLRGETLAYNWAAVVGSCPGGNERVTPTLTEMYVDNATSPDHRRIARACSSFPELGSVVGVGALADGGAIYGRNRAAEPSPAVGAVLAWHQGRRSTDVLLADLPVISSVALARGRLFATVGGADADVVWHAASPRSSAGRRTSCLSDAQARLGRRGKR